MHSNPTLFVVIFWRNPLAQMEEERKDYESKMQVMKDEMEVVFEAKVKEKVKRLEDSKVEASVFMMQTITVINNLNWL